MPLVDKENLKTYAKKTSDNQDALFTSLAASVSAFIETLINFPLDETEREEVYSGDGSQELMLNFLPITEISILSLDIDKPNQKYRDPIDEKYYFCDLDSGIVKLYDHNFTKGLLGNYVKYKAGYAAGAMPDDLVDIASQMGAKRYQDIEEKRMGITTKNIMGDNVSFTFLDLSPEGKDIISLYRKQPGRFGVLTSGYALET